MRPGAVFYKMSGSGNDFLVFDGRYAHREDFTPEAVRAICDRRQGAGADGVILLDPAAPPGAHFTFHFWNSDGTAGPMCGNGALCAIRLATLIELAPPDGEVAFATPAGLHRGRIEEGRPVVQLPDCPLPRPVPAARTEAGERSPHFAEPTVPHLVVLVEDVETIQVAERGPVLRHDPTAGPEGANANWVARSEDTTFRMRTYERGVEGETLACGTGAVACALVVAGLNLAQPPVRIWARSGLPLDVTWVPAAGRATSITLSGEGRLVYRGIVA